MFHVILQCDSLEGDVPPLKVGLVDQSQHLIGAGHEGGQPYTV